MAKPQISAKPRMFIGSSSESKGIVNSYADHLKDVAHVKKWWESNSFRPTYSTLGSLQFAAWEHDFGLFIFSRDDETRSRGGTKPSPRDNVLLELGLFLGTLGPDRTFVSKIQGKRKDQKVKVPSDLDGINLPTVEGSSDPEIQKEIADTAAQFRERVSKLGFCHNRLNIRYSYEYDRKSAEFRMWLNGAQLQIWKELLRDKEFVLVSLLKDDFTDFHKDTRIAIGEPRQLSEFGDDLGLRVAVKRAFTPTKGDIVSGCLILMPKGSSTTAFSTVGSMFNQGGQLVARVGQEI